MGYIIFVFIFILWVFHYHGIPIFLYHQVHPESNVTPELFESHLAWIQKKGYQTMTLSEWIEEGAAKKTVLITLDDGYYDNYKYVFPLLKKYGIKATIFLNTLYIAEKREKETEIQKNGLANQEAIAKYLACGSAESSQYMSWEEIREMYESGLVDFQAHSHKHMAVFSEIQLQGFFTGKEIDCTDTYLYGEIKEGYPIFKKRGEYSMPGFTIQKEFFPKFEDFFHKYLKTLKDEKKRIEEGQKFIEQNLKYFHQVSAEEFEKRVLTDFEENQKQIEKHLKNEVKCFCWPWGHRSKETLKTLKKIGVEAFVTTKKGTNDQIPNCHFIYRIELRKYTLRKFTWNLRIASNLILGKLYGLVS